MRPRHHPPFEAMISWNAIEAIERSRPASHQYKLAPAAGDAGIVLPATRRSATALCQSPTLQPGTPKLNAARHGVESTIMAHGVDPTAARCRRGNGRRPAGQIAF